MYLFWDTILYPIFEALEPGDIVEIGVDEGKNTKKILEYCENHGATLHAIDPMPQFDMGDWQKQYTRSLKFYKLLSLNALPLIEQMDIVLVDGDHNWYTVYNELKLIERHCKSKKCSFPMVILHDVGWPYARRDLYYNPDNIPVAYLKPHKKKGIRPGTPELVEKEGMNSHLNNAIYENNIQNGVLTAVEDFISETSLDLELITIPPYHGIGFLYPLDMKENKKIRALAAEISSSKFLLKMLGNLEKDRIGALLDGSILHERISTLEHSTQAELSERARKLHEIEELRQAEGREHQVALNKLEKSLNEQEEAQRTEQQRYENLLKQKADQIENYQVQVENYQTQVENYQTQVENYQAQVESYQHQVLTRDNTIAQMNAWICQLQSNYHTFIASRRWRLGNFIVNLAYKLSFKRKEPEDVNQMANIFNQFDTYHRNKKIANSSSCPGISEDLIELQTIILELKQMIDQLLNSRRWKIGNTAGKLAASLSRKEKEVLFVTNLRRVFSKYEQWEPVKGHDEKQLKQLSRWIEELDQNYKLLVAGRRWQTGNKIVSTFNKILFRRSENPIIEAIEELISRYHNWQQKRDLVEKNTEKYFNHQIYVTPQEAVGDPYRLMPPLNNSREIPLPSNEILDVGTGDFIGIGEWFVSYFIDNDLIKPTDKILDVGCGIGRMAIPLTRYLNPEGCYYGFDIVENGIEWCQNNISSLYPNFHFTHSDIINKSYNRNGRIKASEYIFPYRDNTFDFVFLTSVFTHTLAAETEHYLSEIARIIKKGGRTFITYFILDEESKKLINEDKSSLLFKYISDQVYTVDLDVPENAIAYDQEYIVNLYNKHKFQIENIHYGNWCEREETLSYQDIIIAVKN